MGETRAPTLTAGGLWNQTGWVRGSWPITANGDSPSGVCSLSASLQGDPAAVTQTFSPDPSAWHQCNAIGEGGLSGTINTTLAANGADTLSVSDADAAGLTAGDSKTLDVDNETPTIALTGPANALSTAGTQDVTVSVDAGPSGAYGADCSVDGGASTFYAGATVQVPVSGIGQHTVTCVGLNNAVDSSGTRASSSPESFSMDIQQPSQEAITFSKKIGGLTCHTVVKKVQKLGKRRTVTLKGHKVQVRRVRYVKHKVRKCHAATVKRKVLVELKHDGKVVRRHGKIVRVKRVRQVVLLPHRVHKTVRHVEHGAETTVSGYLLSDGTPLADQTVAVLAAPNSADPQFSAISSAITNANGFWVAKVPAGPSRLLQAQFAGSATTAAADSTLVRLKVPAKIRILSHTKRTAWGQTVDFTGRLYGGHIPRSGVNIRLRYGYSSHSITYGVKTHVGPDGRFRTKFTFGPGAPNDRYRFHFQFSTLPGGNYPWAVARSNEAFVAVGGHPHRHARHHRRTHTA